MKVSGKMKVKTLKAQFHEEFGLTLRVYDGKSFAGDDATLASIRKGESKGGELSPRKNMKISNLEKNLMDMFGIKVQVSGSDDSYLCDNNDTLAKAEAKDRKKTTHKNSSQKSEDITTEIDKKGAIMEENDKIKWVDYLEVDVDCISYRPNDETRCEFSDDFEGDGMDQEEFEEMFFEKCNSSGSLDTFRENMNSLASMVKQGECIVFWVTCEAECDRLDIRFRPNNCSCFIYSLSTDIWPEYTDYVYESYDQSYKYGEEDF